MRVCVRERRKIELTVWGKKVPIALDGIRTCISGIRAHSASDCTTTAGTPPVCMCTQLPPSFTWTFCSFVSFFFFLSYSKIGFQRTLEPQPVGVLIFQNLAFLFLCHPPDERYVRISRKRRHIRIRTKSVEICALVAENGHGAHANFVVEAMSKQKHWELVLLYAYTCTHENCSQPENSSLACS